MQEGKFQDLQGELASLETQESCWLVPVWIQRPENQENWWCSSDLKAGTLEIQEEPVSPFESKARKKASVPVQRQAGKNSLFLEGESIFLFYSGLQLIRWGPPTLGRVIFFTQSTNLNVRDFPGGPVVKTVLLRTSLVVQWLRIHLPTQGTWVRALVREDPTCCRATKPVCHNYWPEL